MISGVSLINYSIRRAVLRICATPGYEHGVGVLVLAGHTERKVGMGRNLIPEGEAVWSLTEGLLCAGHWNHLSTQRGVRRVCSWTAPQWFMQQGLSAAE